MRVLFTVFGPRAHLYPMVPLAWAFRAAGHEVRMASTPAFADDLVHTGLPAVPVGRGPGLSAEARQEINDVVYGQEPWPADWAADPHALDERQRHYLTLVGRYLVRAADAMVDEVVSFARQWRPELIVYDPVSYAGAVAAAVLDVPSVRHLFGTASVPRVELAHPGPEPLPEYVRLFERFGLDPRLDPTVHIDPTPPRMRVAAEPPYLDERYVAHNGPGSPPDGLSAPRTRPRVCLTWGYVIGDAIGGAAADPYRDAMEAVTATGAEAIVLTSPEQLRRLGALPANTRALAGVPLNLVLPSCDAVLHQGGDGTTLTTATFGLPQLVISRKPDHDLTGGRLAAVGAGIHLRHQDLQRDPGRRHVIRDAMAKLLADSAYRDAAGRLREEIEAQPTPAELVPRITALAGADR
jgi:glycosyltransferase